MHLVIRDKTGTPSRLSSNPVIKGTTWCWQPHSRWVTPGPDTPDRPPARRLVGEKKDCTKAYLVADCSFGDWLFLCLSSAVSSSITHLSAMSSLDVFFMRRQKANDRTWREPDGSAQTLTTGCVASHSTKTHGKHICPGGILYSDNSSCASLHTETVDLLNDWPPEPHLFFFMFC